MTASSKSEGPSTAASPPKTRGLVPGHWTWLIAGIFFVSLVLTYSTNWVNDHAITNIMTIVFVFDILGTFAIWYIFFSGYAESWRMGLLKALGIVLVVAIAILRPVRTSGDLLPSFRFVWQPARSEPPAPVTQASSQSINLAAQQPEDFRQYLGPARDMHVPAIDLDDDWVNNPPQLVWRQPIGAGWSGFVVANGYAITMEQRGEEELVTCYRRDRGQLIWSHGIKGRHSTLLGGTGPRSTPMIDENRVYALGATGVLRCLDGANGELMWQVDLLQEFGVPPGKDGKQIAWGRAASPLVVDQWVVIPAGGPKGQAVSLAAFDKLTGERRWVAGDDQISYSSPALYTLCGVRQIVIVNEHSVTGHQVEDGAILWSFPWSSSSTGTASTSQPMQLDESRLLVSRGYNKGAAEIKLARNGDQWTAEQGWKSGKVLRTKLTSAVIHNGYAYGLNDGVLQCVDYNNGKLMWKAGRLRHGQPIMVGNDLLVMSEWGELQLYHAGPERPQRSPPDAALPHAINGTAWNTLCVSGEYLLVRSDQEAACYRLPTRPTD